MTPEARNALTTLPDAALVSLTMHLVGGNAEEWVIRDQIRRLREAEEEENPVIRVRFLD